MQPKHAVSVKRKGDALSDGVPRSNDSQGLYVTTAGATDLSVQEGETIHCSHGGHKPGEKQKGHTEAITIVASRATWFSH